MSKPSNSLLLIILLMVPYCTYAQKVQTIYYDSTWHVTDKAHASYYRTAKKLTESKYYVEDHFLNGKIQMTGYYSPLPDEDDINENGYFVYFDSSGHKKYEGSLDHGKSNGLWKYYFPGTNTLSNVFNYKDGIRNGHIIFYDSVTNNVHLEGDCSNDKQNGKWTEYYPGNGQLKLSKWYTNGLLDGELVGYYKNGKLKRKETYIKDTCKKGNCYDENGKEIEFTQYHLIPMPPTTLYGSSRSFSGNGYILPKGKHKIPVTFLISKNGEILNFEEGGLFWDPQLIKEFIRKQLLSYKNYGQWSPAKDDGIPVDCYAVIWLDILIN